MARRRYKQYDLSRIMHAKYTPVNTTFNWYTIIVTWFFVGRIPVFSGTLGTLAFYPIFYLVMKDISSIEAASKIFYAIAAVLFLIGLLAISKFQEETGTYDHSCVVIDEVVGIALTLAISLHWLEELAIFYLFLFDWKVYNVIFLFAVCAFRFFDIYKPLFISYVDRYYKNPFGVLLDDVLAAFFASGTFYIFYTIYAYARY